jgi:hypothetical protein
MKLGGGSGMRVSPLRLEQDLMPYLVALMVLTIGLATALVAARILVSAILSSHPIWP